MKKYKIKNKFNSYNLVGDNLFQTEKKIGSEGEVFIGQSVFIPIGKRLVPMIKLHIEKKGLKNFPSENIYFDLSSVSPVMMSVVSPSEKKSSKNDFSSFDDYPQYEDAEHSSALGGILEGIDIFKPQEVTEKEMKDAYKDSGSNISFKDWIKTEQATDLAKDLINKALNNGNDNSNKPTSLKTDDSVKEEVRILGMHPLTFGIVSISILIGGALAVSLIKGSK